MIQFVKVKLYSKIDNSLLGNGIIVKYTHNGQALWYFIHKVSTMSSGFNGDVATSVSFGDEHRFCVSNGSLMRVDLHRGSPVDSFETLLLSERARTDSVFARYRVILGDEVFNCNNNVFDTNIDDLFIVEARETASVSGVLIKNAYTQDRIYSGFASYHHHDGRGHFNTPIHNDKPYRIGVELELYARSREAYRKITGARTNWFMCESDGSLTQNVGTDDNNSPTVSGGISGLGIEMKTIPLRPVDATSVDFWDEPMSKLAKLAVSAAYKTTGLHVHISKEILGANEAERKRNLKKLILFYEYYVEDDPVAKEKNKIICGRALGYSVNARGAKTDVGDVAKLMGMSEAVKNTAVMDLVTDSLYNQTSSQRGDINVRPWDSYGTIEFRKGDGRISKKRLAAICAWWEQMCLYCKETPITDLSFNDFFTKICRDYPAVAYFFGRDEEC